MPSLPAHVHRSAASAPPVAQRPPSSVRSDFEAKLFDQSPVYQALQVVKHRCNHDQNVSAEFDRRRQRYHFNAPQTQFRDQFLTIFTDINLAVGKLFVDDNVHVFLDLGCAPGGFSKFILDNNSRARGMGVTLPGLPVVRDGALADESRYLVKEANLVELDFDRQSTTFRPPSRRIQLEKDGYDLIIAGAFPTGQQISFSDRATLALSQLHAVLSNLQAGGTCVLVANTKTFLWNAEMFAVLRRTFRQIVPAKHAELHAIRSSCYFVCTGFQPDVAEELSLKMRVKSALNTLKMPFEEGMNNEPIIFSGLLSASEFFKEEHRQFLDIMEPLWIKQCEAIEEKLGKTARRGSYQPEFRGSANRNTRQHHL
ncbi:hypothetical protein FIBSPDRAFT_603932 [Athelia psychrophila]|uniref:Ribosomal RNA methyltransferase FtsJ domain-containing protein n=1 Tax=Athelia psychrophila TaxID=1759441 RepID=A0A166GRC9_9AGAM|nr:hypothetical protein FIBSPDRAFT_603932 [Fibularhizoctonia sp. CBS 109695]